MTHNMTAAVSDQQAAADATDDKAGSQWPAAQLPHVSAATHKDSLDTPGQISSEGAPSSLKMQSSCCCSLLRCSTHGTVRCQSGASDAMEVKMLAPTPQSSQDELPYMPWHSTAHHSVGPGGLRNGNMQNSTFKRALPY